MSGQRTRKSEFQDCSDSKGNNAARRLVLPPLEGQQWLGLHLLSLQSLARQKQTSLPVPKLTYKLLAHIILIIKAPTPPVVCTTMMIMVWRKSLHEKPPNRHGTKSLSGLKQLRQDSASRKELPSSF
eukprot:463199-Pelagomonas_calceolata.AAC.2